MSADSEARIQIARLVRHAQYAVKRGDLGIDRFNLSFRTIVAARPVADRSPHGRSPPVTPRARRAQRLDAEQTSKWAMQKPTPLCCGAQQGVNTLQRLPASGNWYCAGHAGCGLHAGERVLDSAVEFVGRQLLRSFCLLVLEIIGALPRQHIEKVQTSRWSDAARGHASRLC